MLHLVGIQNFKISLNMETYIRKYLKNNYVSVSDYNESADHASSSQVVMFNSPDKYGSAKFTSNSNGFTDSI